MFLHVPIFLLKDPDFNIVLVAQNPAAEILLGTSKF